MPEIKFLFTCIILSIKISFTCKWAGRMYRSIEAKLLEWKSTSKGKTALLIDGARRVGKSYICEKFAKEHYKSYIIIDFNIAKSDVLDIFESYLTDLDTFYQRLSAWAGVKLFKRESLIIFDEVQEFPKARAALKYLVADGRFDFIETGSLMSINKNVKDIIIPSEEVHIKMYPMTFHEFMVALNQEALLDLITDCYQNKKPLGQALHRKAIDKFRLYMLVGGMPQSVSSYLETEDFNSVDLVKRNILSLYRADISKHAGADQLKVKAIFDDIPAQLAKHDRKFRITSLSKHARTRNYEDALFWLSDSMIANFAYNTTDPKIGLKLNMERSTYKCYLADTGLLISHSFDERGLVKEEVYKKILFDKLSVNLGMLTENIVAQMLVACGHKLYFFSNPDRENAANRMEIDFLIGGSKITSRHNISPIEVKSGKNYTLSSLRKFIAKYNDELACPYVIHMKDFEVKNNITYLPIYMTELL